MKYSIGQKIKIDFHGIPTEATVMVIMEVAGDYKTVYGLSIPFLINDTDTSLTNKVTVDKVVQMREEEIREL